MNMTRLNTRKVFVAVYRSGNPDSSKGFRGWQHKAQITRKALLAAKAEIDKQLAEWRETYTEKAIQPMYQNAMEDYAGLRKIAVDKLEAAIADVEKEKREQYRKIALTAPTDEQLRLIQALSFRDDLTADEVYTISEQLGDNLQAMKALGSVARQAGIHFPRTITTEEFEDALGKAAQYAHDVLYSIDKPELGYNDHCFYNYDGTGWAHMVFDPLDSPMFAAVQEQNDKAAEKPNTEAKEGGEMWTRVTLNGTEYLSTVAAQFHVSEADIRRINGLTSLNGEVGQKILIPATRFTMQPGHGHIQPDQCELVPAPSAEEA